MPRLRTVWRRQRRDREVTGAEWRRDGRCGCAKPPIERLGQEPRSLVTIGIEVSIFQRLVDIEHNHPLLLPRRAGE
ncbi:MAG: hypothetical protein LC797_04070 [Chloroflexi bacterium]|nr:hypothetical protein [Chloroflexota bacterium]